MAALKIGCEMPYHVIDKTADELTEEDIRELRIADNQTNAETGFDFDTLSADIDGLEFEGFDFDFGFNMETEDNDNYVDDFFDRGVEAKEKPVVLGVKVICGTKEQVDEVMAMLKEAGYSPEEL